MNITQQSSPVEKIIVEGEMAGDRVNKLETEFLEKLENFPSGTNVILDLLKVIRIDSRAISLCIGLYKECLQHNFTFSIEAGPEAYRILLQINLNRVFSIREVS